jgi:L-fucose isomerase-like protein
MKDLLSEKNAQGLTMAYGDDPLPVPCFAYANMRDEGIPSACEADIVSLIVMTILHYVVDKPSFMGNISAYPRSNILRISHCTAPTKMAGYDKTPHSYILRDQHWGPPKGVLSAFVPMDINQKVTICRLDGELKNMVVTRGEIAACRDLKEYCRLSVDIRVGNVRKLIHSASGNHHVMVYGDYREEVSALNELFGITTVKV